MKKKLAFWRGVQTRDFHRGRLVEAPEMDMWFGHCSPEKLTIAISTRKLLVSKISKLYQKPLVSCSFAF